MDKHNLRSKLSVRRVQLKLVIALRDIRPRNVCSSWNITSHHQWQSSI